MKQKDIDAIIDKNIQESSEYWNKENFEKRIAPYLTNGSIDIHSAMDFMQKQSADYCQRFVRNVLSDLLVDSDK